MKSVILISFFFLEKNNRHATSLYIKSTRKGNAYYSKCIMRFLLFIHAIIKVNEIFYDALGSHIHVSIISAMFAICTNRTFLFFFD